MGLTAPGNLPVGGAEDVVAAALEASEAHALVAGEAAPGVLLHRPLLLASVARQGGARSGCCFRLCRLLDDSLLGLGCGLLGRWH